MNAPFTGAHPLDTERNIRLKAGLDRFTRERLERERREREQLHLYGDPQEESDAA